VEDRILILAPRGRDAQVIAQLLKQRGLSPYICSDATCLLRALREGAASAIVTDEAIDPDTLIALSTFISEQVVWSDFPFVVLTGKHLTEHHAALKRLLITLGNAVLVERPVSPDSLYSAAVSALRARRRQYQARQLIADKECAAMGLRDADRRKDHFLAMLAHELRNPLAPIRSAAEVLKRVENECSPRVGWARKLIERQSRQLSSLLEDLLDVSRITTGKVSINKTELLFNALVARAVETAQSGFDTRKHTVTVSLPESLVFVMGDAIRLTQVVANLLDNASKYTPPGGRIHVEVAIHAERVSLTISDNGVGISAEDLPYVFELFNQADRALDRAQGGLGIGLSLVRSILVLHDGSISAASEGQGKGTRVEVLLPLLSVLDERFSSNSAEEAPGHHPSTVDKDERKDIVIIDDNLDAAEALATLLDLNGHVVRVSPDGPSGLETCKARWPDVVLLDIGLPGMDGYQVARHLRDAAAGRPLALIALTGYGQPDDLRRAQDAGFDHHLVKPVELARLASLI
jgi:signal transduction histidine kinase